MARQYRSCSPVTHMLNHLRLPCRYIHVLQVLNETFSGQLREYMSPHFSLDDASFISIDASGADVRVRLGSEFNVERLGFDQKVNNLEEAITAVRHVLEY